MVSSESSINMKQSAAVRDSQDIFASAVALATHPVVIGTLSLFTVVLNTTSVPQEQFLYVILLMLLTFAPAALYLFVLFKGNIVEMLELINREARLIPYILMIVGAIIAVITLVMIEAPRAIFIMTLVLLANEIVLGTVNFWTKVSIHTATPTFTAITLAYLLHPAWISLIFLVPLIGWARVYRQRHTLKQVVGGTVFASAITSLVIALSHYYL